jgi:hypothetical protein
MDTIHLVMMRYTMDGSPLDDGGEYAEQVRYACADLGNAELLAIEMESDNYLPDTQWFVRSHSIVPTVKQSPVTL